MRHRRGFLFLCLLPLAFLSYDIGRHVLVNQNVPAFFVEKTPDIQIALDGHPTGATVVQISDGFLLEDVIKVTNLALPLRLQKEMTEIDPFKTGERFVLQVVNGEVVDYSRVWMSAVQRVVLGIPLHPDRMSEKDWDYLPGVGTSLAAAIEEDRQNNGDFNELTSLERVRGIGPKRIARWREFF